MARIRKIKFNNDNNESFRVNLNSARTELASSVLAATT